MQTTEETMVGGTVIGPSSLPHEESYLEFRQKFAMCGGDWSTKGIHLGFEYREFYRNTYSFAIPTVQAIKKIASYGPVVEIGAGRGYWAYLLSTVGNVEVKALDNGSWKLESSWYPVEDGTPSDANDYPNHTLFLCWPPYDEPMAYTAATSHYLAGGKVIAYVGEGTGGCTGDDDFHSYLDENYHDPIIITIPQLPMLHDRLYIYERR